MKCVFKGFASIIVSVILLMGCSDDNKKQSDTDTSSDSNQDTDSNSSSDNDTGTEPVITECNDGIDNDSDGFIDWVYDLGCANEDDKTETAQPRENENGFTTFDPPASGVILYISAEGSDENDGTTPETSLATFAKAKELADNDGSGAWILFKRGDVFKEEAYHVTEFHGASETDRVLVASYGESKERPVLLNGRISSIKTLDNVAIVGLEVRAEGRNPKSENFNSADSPSGIGLTTSGKNVLIEGCLVSYGSMVVQAYGGDGTLSNIEIRRNVIHHGYSVDSHAQGLYTHDLDGLLVEENVFDHNGWLIQQIDTGNDQEEGQATFFNHNLYLSASNDVVVKGNLILRAASMGIKMRSDETDGSTNVTIEDNLFFEGEIGVGIGGNTDELKRFVNTSVSKNVFMFVGRSRPTNRTLAWAIDVAGNHTAKINENYILYQDDDIVTNSYGINLASAYLHDVTVDKNVMYRLNNRGFRFSTGTDFSTISITNNLVQMDSLESKIADVTGALDAFTFSNNQYSSSAQADQWFRVDSNSMNLSDWNSSTGDSSTNTKVSFSDPTQNIISYQKSLDQEATDQAFIDEAIKLSPWNWNTAYTAKEVNTYIKAGFSIK